MSSHLGGKQLCLTETVQHVTCNRTYQCYCICLPLSSHSFILLQYQLAYKTVAQSKIGVVEYHNIAVGIVSAYISATVACVGNALDKSILNLNILHYPDNDVTLTRTQPVMTFTVMDYLP